MISVEYTEKLVEELIRDYPADFLREPLTLLAQQPTLAGFRPDLIFKKPDNSLLIVEVQINALDRAHLYRAIEYRDLYKLENPEEEVEVAVFCNSIDKKFVPIAKIHEVRIFVYVKSKFLLKAKSLRPELKLKRKPNRNNDMPLYAKRVLREMRKKREPGDTTSHVPDKWKNALAVWKRSWRDPKEDFQNLQARDLRKHPRVGHVAINGQTKSIDWEKEFDVPEEIIINFNDGEKAHVDTLQTILDWLDLAYGFGKEEIVLGYRQSTDLFDYESHIENRIRKFQPIWSYYKISDPNSWKPSWDQEKLRRDLQSMQDFGLVVGFFPHFKEIKLLRGFDIQSGPGGLLKNWDNIRSNWLYRGYEAEVKEIEDNFDKEFTHWVSVKLDFSGPLLTYYFRNAAKILFIEHSSGRKIEWGPYWDSCLLPLRKLGLVPRSSLELSAKYFAHLVEDDRRDPA